MPNYFYVMTGQVPGRGLIDANGTFYAPAGIKRSDVFKEVLGHLTEAAGQKPAVTFWSIEEDELGTLEPVEDLAAVDQDEAGL
jgi:hypothetical protein